ncbi:MAG TPA: ABC transporter substrate-binding protein [Trueperaceae bacterium]|nr:ABC transporter substrate-binding protein [Trueperaceae bacterium]
MIGTVRKLTWRRSLMALAAGLLALSTLSVGSAQQGEIPLNPEVSGDVEFWHFWGSPVRRNAIRRVVAQCQAELPNITVTETFKPWGDIWTANIAAVAARSGMPDVIVADRLQLPRDAADGIYQSLGDMVEADNIQSSAFWDFTWQQTLYEGESYGLPFETDVRVLFYNKNVLEEAGLDPENPPATWEELWAAADALDVKNEDGTFERIAFFPLYGNVGVDLWAMANGHEFVVDGQPVVDDPAVAETLEWMKRWIDRYGGWSEVQRFLAQYGAAPNDAFMAGGVVMKVDTAGYNSILNFYRPKANLADGSTPNMDWGVSLPPYEVEPATWSGGFTLSIPSGAENPEAAWEFIKCAASRPGQVSWARDTYSIPSDIAAARDPVLMADPAWGFFIDAMEVGKLVPFVPAYSNWIEQLNSRLESVWTDATTIEEALSEAQQEIDRTIEQNR